MFKKLKVHLIPSIQLVLLAAIVGFVSCKKEEEAPAVQVTALNSIEAATFSATAIVKQRGDYKILDYGFEYSYSTSSSETGISFQYKISKGSNLPNDIFVATFTLSNIYYYSSPMFCYVRAYIVNEKGTVYSNVMSKEILRASVSSIVPNFAKAGDTLSIVGNNFSTNLSSNTVTFNNTQATITSVTSTKMRVVVPQNISSYYYDTYISVLVTSAGQVTDINSSFILAPGPTGFSPKTGTWSNTYITITGSGFYGTSIYFDEVQVSSNNSNSNSISVYVPNSIAKKRFKIYLLKQGIKTEVPGGYFTMNALSVNPIGIVKYIPGANVNVTASNYHPLTSNNFLIIGSTKIQANYTGSSPLQFTLPTTISEGTYTAKLSNSLDTVNLSNSISIVTPKITGLSKTSGYPGTTFTIQGKYLFNYGIMPYYYFNLNGSYSPSTYDSTTITVRAPWVQPGSYKIKVNFGSYSVESPTQFTVTEPPLTSIVPSSGIAGTSVIINGEGFGTGNSINVYFGNLSAPILSSSNTQINVKVPTGVTSGVWLVKVVVNYYEISNTLTFTVP